MKFGILSQYYPPEIGAPQARLSELASRMAARGHEVTVLTALPNYPLGRIHPGYRGLTFRERHDGVDVIRTAIYATQSAARTRRLLNYFSFCASSLAIGSARLPRLDYLMVESPPLFLGPVGVWLARLKGARLIFNVSDLWPESAVRVGALDPESAAHRTAARVEAYCYRNAALITGQSRSIVADIAQRFPGAPVFHFSNGVDTKRFGPHQRDEALRTRLSNGREILVLYTGLHGLAQGLSQVLDAAERLLHDVRIQVALVGDGPEKADLIEAARSRGLSNLAFHDPVPFARMPSLIAAADIALVTLKTDITGAVPSKLYEAMASARPVVLAAGGEAAAVVNDHRAGFAVPPGDVPALVQAITALSRDPALRDRLGASGRAAAASHFDRDAICARFIDRLQQ